uniref:syntaphilin-like isoform X2 n=1 Tax=Myxine glutinosa TaxID=7769 RepID=UPI00358EDC71
MSARRSAFRTPGTAAPPVVIPPRRSPSCTTSWSGQSSPSACGTVSTGPSRSNDGSPTHRRTKANMEITCGKRTGEAYLTPLQQKEVAIRHLRSKLKETQCLLLDRESEVEELKERVNRIQEDRAVEESQQAEAQLSVKHSKREIKRLRSVINTMKSILLDKDKGVPKYFIDINVQNKRLEALLETVDKMQESHKVEEQSIISKRDGHSESESKTSETSGAETDTGEEADEEDEEMQEEDEVETKVKSCLEKGDMAELEAGAAIGPDGSFGGDGSIMHQRWATKEQVELRLCDSSARTVAIHVQTGQRVPRTPSQQSLLKLIITSPTGGEDLTVPTESYRDNKDEGVQTDTIGSPFQRPTLQSSACSPLESRTETVTTLEDITLQEVDFPSSNHHFSQVPSSTANVITNEPKSGICSADVGLSGVCPEPHQAENRLSMSFSECSCLAPRARSSSCSSSLGNGDQEKHGPAYPSTPASIDEAVEPTCAAGELVCQHGVPFGPRYWSRHALLDTLAVAVPLLPTVAWFIVGRGGSRALGEGPQTFSSLPALLRGCSLLALRTLRSVPQSLSSPLCSCTNPPMQQADARPPPSGPSEC